MCLRDSNLLVLLSFPQLAQYFVTELMYHLNPRSLIEDMKKIIFKSLLAQKRIVILAAAS